jgi:hypothetical protein
MLYVTKQDGKIYNERALYRALKVMRSQPPRQQDLDDWNAAVLQPDNLPVADVVSSTQTASEGVDGLWYRNYTSRAFTVEELTNYKNQAIRQVNSHLQSLVDELTEIFPEYTKDTFYKQKEEAELWNTDNNTPTPLIDRVLQFYSGPTKQQYVNGVINKLSNYYNAAGKYIGIQMEAKQQINQATTRVDIDAVVAQVLAL